MRILTRFLVALGLLACAAVGAANELPERNIVLFVTDDEGTQLGCYGDKSAITPNIDRLAAEGTRFNFAFATTASCSASRSVILSGLHNHLNGQFGHQHHFHKFASYRDVISLSLPRVLANSGYRTAQIGKYHVAPEEVYRFETYLKGNGRNAVTMADACQDFISKQDDRPFFLYFATSDPHRGGGIDKTSTLRLKPDLFGNKPNRGRRDQIDEQFFDPHKVSVPAFLPDTPESRSELAQYYQSCSRIDQGLGRLIEILKETGVYDKTMIVFTSDHGMAFPGAKTTVYEPGLRVPFVVHNPYASKGGVVSSAMISHIDITPSLVDFAGGLDRAKNAPKNLMDSAKYWTDRELSNRENRNGGNTFETYQGKSWLDILDNENGDHWQTIYASHTFHEIQMYYPMRAVRDKEFKLIWNIAYKLDYPFATDLWAASTWQAQFQLGQNAPYGTKSVDRYIHRPRFELYDMTHDVDEATDLASNPEYAEILQRYQTKLRELQEKLKDPWISKWKYE